MKNVECFVCGKTNLSYNEVGLNKKMIGRNVVKLHCMQCLADYLEVSLEDLIERIEDFKNSGCTLFE